MKITKKHITNIAFVVLIGLMLYPPTKVYFIRLISFSPSINTVENQKTLQHTDWMLKGINTESLNFTTLDNNVVFVSFWATWCPPCVAEMPSMKALYEDYKDNVTFLFITNENWNTVSKFYTKNNYHFPTYNQVTNAPKEFESASIPATFIVSKNKKIVIDKKGPADWNSDTIRELLDQLLKEKE
jgi:thiol-disulfide isomerase/thioredoxin